jgi:hypothetical protein
LGTAVATIVVCAVAAAVVCLVAVLDFTFAIAVHLWTCSVTRYHVTHAKVVEDDGLIYELGVFLAIAKGSS